MAASLSMLLGAASTALIPPGEATASAPLPLDPLIEPDPSVLDDGYGHYIVEVPAHELPAAEAPPTIEALAAHPGVVDVTLSSGPYWAVSTTLDGAQLRAAAERAGAVSVQADAPLVAYSNDPYSMWLWGLQNEGGRVFPNSPAATIGVADVDADGVEARAAVEGNGVVVAVVDSGVQASHEDLGPLWRNPGETSCSNGVDDDANGYVDDCNGWDFYNDDNTLYDPGADNNHGTHITSTIASIPDNGLGTAGLAPGVTVMNVKVLQQNAMWMSDGAAAIRYAVDNGADIINASWGSRAGVTRPQVAALESAIEHARSHGVIIVAAAGNDGVNLDAEPHWPASFPQENLITVGSHQADDQPSWFSNYSTTTVDLYAPGHYIVAGVDGSSYGAMQGTSMAAPHVTAAGALVIAQQPDATVAQIRSALLSSVDPVPALATRSATGGRLNAARALGLNPDAGDPLEVTVDGADELAVGEPSELTVTAKVPDPAVTSGHSVEVRATILTAIGGTAYGVTDLPLAVNGARTTTDELASVAISSALAPDSAALREGISTTLGVTLPQGTYALVFELVDVADAAIAYGPAATVFVTIGSPAAASTTTTTATDPGGSSPTTTAPPGGGSPTTTVAPGGSTPTTVAPGGSTPTTAPSGGTTPTTAPAGPTTTTTVPTGGTTPTTAPQGGSPLPTIPPGGTTPTTAPGGPTPTTVPSGGTTPTTAPAGTTTTTAPTGTTTPTTTPPPPPDPVENDGIRITQVRPSSGPVEGGTTVTINGSGFPQYARVFFGDRTGYVISRSPTLLVVSTPRSPVAGAVDVTVADYLGNDVTMPDAFAFTGSPPGGTTPTTSPGATTSTTAPGVTSTTAPGGATSTTAPADATTSTTEPADVPPDPTPSTGRSRLVRVGNTTDWSGLRLVEVANIPVSAPPSAWGALSCQAATCVGVLNL